MNNFKSLLNTSLLTLSLAGSFGVDAATYKRFWRGQALPELTSSEFVKRVNQQIIPATRELFKKDSGLISYQPFLTSKLTLNQSNEVAEEFALLEYESEDAYKKYRATAEGQAYGDLHWEMFDKTNSKSAVIEPYSQKVEITHAYDLLAKDIDFKKTSNHVSVYVAHKNVNPSTYLEAVKNYLDETKHYAPSYGLLSMYVLIMDDHLVVYEAWDHSSSRSEYQEIMDGDMPTGELIIDDVANLTMQTQLSARAKTIAPGEGIKVLKD